ncbi:MAG TPA: calcium-binding protein [Allosphingosinicella sp.]|nr:calcium-binding protein [Allosphingosinicella sp.]
MAIITGTGGNDTLTGTGSADQIFGLGGDDILSGGGGSDQLDGGTGADAMSGGTGNDIYFVDDIGDSVIENAGEGTDEVRTTLNAYTLGANVEKLRFTGSGSFAGTGNALNNEIHGGAAADILIGGAGWDYLIGGADDDSLYGGADGDTLDGGLGADYMEGNSGDDVYIVNNAGDTVVEALGEGTDHVYSSLSSYTLGADFENLTYNALTGNFVGTGNALDNVIYSGTGADTLSGLDGNDELRGGVGADSLSGGDGDDLVVGGADADTLGGGADADTFRWSTSFESGLGANADRIVDFAQGTDIIDLAGADADIFTPGNQAFAFIGNAAFSSTAGELRSFDDGTDTWVQADIDGDGMADFEIALTGVMTLAGADFIL